MVSVTPHIASKSGSTNITGYAAKVGTTHWPNALHSGTNVAKRNGQPDNISRTKPLNEPVLSERAFKLTGIPYIKV